MGKSKDSALGMSRQITRRDFLDGVALTIGAAAVPLIAIAQDKDSLSFPPPEGQGADESAQEPLLAKGISEKDPRYYPPALTGMRGSHPGSFEAAHALRNGEFWSHAGQQSGNSRYSVIHSGGDASLI